MALDYREGPPDLGAPEKLSFRRNHRSLVQNCCQKHNPNEKVLGNANDRFLLLRTSRGGGRRAESGASTRCKRACALDPPRSAAPGDRPAARMSRVTCHALAREHKPRNRAPTLRWCPAAPDALVRSHAVWTTRPSATAPSCTTTTNSTGSARPSRRLSPPT